VDGAWVDTDGSAPYNGWANGLTAGTHALTAVAFGNGLSTTSSVVNVVVNIPVNIAPLAAIVTPENNSSRDECGEVSLTVTAYDPDGTVTNVAYYLNTSLLLGSRTGPPYLLATGLPVGTNNLTAVAADNLGARGTSAVVRVVFTPIPTNAMSANLPAAGQLKLCFRGLVNSNYVFESTTNLADTSAWKPFSTNTAPAGASGLITMFEPFPSPQPVKFYRAHRQP
jgi:hypothetical protein